MSTEPKRPMAGEWWFHNDSEPGDSATSRALLVKCVLDDGMLVVQASSNSGHSIMDPVDFRSMHHEPRCDGWGWVVPEEESEEPLDEGKMVDILVSLFHQIEELQMKEEDLQKQCASLMAALFNVRTEMRTVFGVTTRRFAAICGVSCEQLSKWTGDVLEEQPDFMCKPEAVAFSIAFNNSWGKDEKFANVVTESPDDWVTQDRVPARPGIDERRYVGDAEGHACDWRDASFIRGWRGEKMHGSKNDKCILELRCRRKDYPTVAETGEAVVPMPEVKVYDIGQVAVSVKNEWSVGDKQDDVAEVVEIPVWLVTRTCGTRYVIVDSLKPVENSGYKVQQCRPMRLEVLK